MSFVSANDHPDPVSPQDPLYYAPRSARGMAEPRPGPAQQAEPVDLSPNLPVSRFDEMREEAFAKFARPLESQFADERGRSRGLLATAAAVTLAIGATAILAYVVFNASPRLKSDPAPELAVSISTPALATPTQEAPAEDSQALLEGFKQFQRSQVGGDPAPAGSAAAVKESSDKALLDKFMQWQERK